MRLQHEVLGYWYFSVFSMCWCRAFAEQNLGQMKHVYPGAFVFRQERHIPGNYDRQVFEEYQLTVECNVEETGQGGSINVPSVK